MLIPQTILQFIAIIYALFVIIGAFLIAYTAYKWERKTENQVLRARAFLSESFLKDNWTLLLFVFFLNSITPLDEMLSTFIGDGLPELIKRVTQLGVVIGIVILEYKWFKLVNPEEQKSYSTKRT
jgi:divalent metal cation (Fe/Co/Zn/Cd) transporter